MISKLRFSLIAVIMLVLFGFGLQNEAKGQVAENVFCPGIPNTEGWLDLSVSSASSSFSAGLIGTVEGTAGGAVGGMDWLHADFTNVFQPFPTNTLGAQVVSWWTQAEGRATVLQVTNAFPEPIAVHVRIYGPACQELRNFCDFYSGGDTHAYDFSDLVTNDGIDNTGDAILQGTEGFVVVTAVDDCPSSDVAVNYNGLAATTYVVDADGYEYGVNAYHRAAVCLDIDEPATANLIDNGTFETGPGSVPEWVQVQGTSSVVEASNISPAVNPPLCDDPADPECDAPNANRFMAFVASSSDTATGIYGANAPDGSITSELAAVLGAAASDLIGTGVAETNVTVLESNIFTPGELNDGVTDGLVSYQLALLTDGLDTCDQYAMVCTIDVTGFPTTDPSLQECDCYTFTGKGNSPTGGSCTQLSTQNTTGVDAPDLPAFNFETRSGFVTGTLSAPEDGSSYVVQVITGEKVWIKNDKKTGCSPNTVGAFVDNFRIIEEFNLVLECDGILTGAENAFLTSFTPTALAGQFNLLPGSEEAGADVVLINFQDSYGPPYQPVAAFAHYSPTIWDNFEVPNSCGQFDACYARLGIDDSIIDSDDFTPIGPTTTPPTITPTVPPTITPTVPPTRRPGGGGGGDCSIAGGPVQLGTAMANILIPMIPVAFAFGVRRLRRKK